MQRGNSSVGRAQPCQGWGREFEPRFPLQYLVGVASSSLVSRSNISTNQYHILRGNSSVGRAQPCQGWGREFEPRFPLQIFLSNPK